MQQLQAAVALHNEGEIDQAEAIYRQVLAVDACGPAARVKGRPSRRKSDFLAWLLTRRLTRRRHPLKIARGSPLLRQK